jgi:putative spermidine/putrescine transport system permease protein
VLLFGGALVGGLAGSLRGPDGAWTTAAWTAVLADPSFADALGFSVRTAIIATLLAAVLAVPVAALVREHFWARVGLGLPVLVPHLVVAVTAALWLAPGGLADRLLGGLPVDLVRDRAGIGVIAVYVYKELPFLALLVAAAWSPAVRRRQEAAAVLGTGRLRTLATVVWPAVRMPLVAGSLIVAAFVVGAFEVPLVVGPTYPPTLATLALEHARGSELAGQARAAALLLLTSAVALLLALPAARAARHADV